jgi:hypothetical protein
MCHGKGKMHPGRSKRCAMVKGRCALVNWKMYPTVNSLLTMVKAVAVLTCGPLCVPGMLVCICVCLTVCPLERVLYIYIYIYIYII